MRHRGLPIGALPIAQANGAPHDGGFPPACSYDRRRFLQLAGLAGATTAATAGLGGLTASASAAPEIAGASPPTAAYSADVAVAWFERLTELVKRTPGYSPPVAARSFGYAGVTLYQAVVPGMPSHRSLVGQLDDLHWTPGGAIEQGQWQLVANAALAEISRRLFPTAPADQLAAINAFETSLATSLGAAVPALWRRTAQLRGYAVARAIFEWSKSDGGHEAYLGLPSNYTPPMPPGYWVPTPPGFLPALLPSWGATARWCLACLARRRSMPHRRTPTRPARRSTWPRVRSTTPSTNLTAEQEAIARFWADGAGETSTPSGHWVSILSQCLRDTSARLDVAAEAYARLGIAVNDAFICCWDTKYLYNLLRPVTYIQRHIDSSWLPLLVTPPFPEYTSGHSVQSGASARVLTDQFGVVAFTDDTHADRGLPPRSFSSFDAAAEEAAISRLYGGIHYRFAIDNGVDQGRDVGDAVNALTFRV